jgi:threonine dehydrogenase-like Zn-dependent dehydrogenase
VVVVIGLGLVGNFAAQLFQIAGGEVIGVDIAERRLGIARQCGIGRTVNPSATDLKQAVLDATGGKGADVVVEAIGRSDLIAQGVDLLRRHGEIVLLGSPRARHTMDVTPMLSRIHLQGLRMVGALEWLYSTPENDALKVSITRNYREILGWIQQGRLQTEPLLSHLISPAQCQEAYHGLAHRKEEYIGVVFDWERL